MLGGRKLFGKQIQKTAAQVMFKLLIEKIVGHSYREFSLPRLVGRGSIIGGAKKNEIDDANKARSF